MKKYQLTFIVAFALSLGLTLLSMVVRIVTLSVFFSNIETAEFSTISSLINRLLILFGLAVSFSVFYFLSKRAKIIVMKPTTLALFTGVFLGSSILYMCDSVFYFVVFGSHLGSTLVALEYHLLQIWGSSVYGLWYFFPALTALLFVELREKKSNNNLPEETVQGSQ
ncbi:MAG: hypothetical protein NWF01_11975 [Candidatus Bathyarchaeota archaeon]|nr:hypothetical protein [Candidatus Bathyarchaeota archaeon]